MKVNQRTRWNVAAIALLCIAYVVLRGGSGTGTQTSRPAPLCMPEITAEVQNPAAAGNWQAAPATAGAVMKYVDSPRPDAEAEILAFTMRNELLASSDDYERVRRDLQAIREQYPDMQDIRHTGDYVDGELIVMLVSPLNPMISTAEYDESNRFMQLCREEHIASFNGYDVARLSFPARMNMTVLAERYHPWNMPNLYGESSPNDVSGLEDTIRLTSAVPRSSSLPVDTTWTYEFEHGWLDCMDGCECKDIHIFETNASGDIEFVGRVLEFLPGWEQICLDSWGRPV